ncbi:MAG TPA: oligosaccharide flippase family protein [Candidatus Paceibacterota bacterium]
MQNITYSERKGRLLRFLERHTKTDLTYLFGGGFWLVLDQVAGGLAALFLAIAFAHLVPKEVYGTYRYLLSAFWVLTAFTFTGLPTAMAQAVARGKEGTFRESLRTSFFWSLPLSALALGASGYYFLQGNAVVGSGFLSIAVIGPLIQPSSLFGSFLAAKKNFRALALTGTVFAAVPALALFATMFLSTDPTAFLMAYLLGTAGAGAILTIYSFYRYRPNRVLDPEYKSLGKHFSAMNLLSTLAAQIDKIVVFHYLGAVELAVYAFATAIPEQIRGALGSVSILAMPKFTSRPFAEIRANFWQRLWLYTGGLVLIAILYAIAAPYIFDIFFPTYHEAVFLSQLYVFALIPIGGSLSITLLQAQEAKRELYIINIVTPAFQIVALIVLTATYGLIGAIIARIAGRIWSFVISSIMLELYSRRKS